MLTQPNILAAYLYLHHSDVMPEPVLDIDGHVDVEADNAALEAWHFAPSVFEVDLDRLERFISDVAILLDRLSDVEDGDYMTLFYDAAKATFDDDRSQIRTWFGWLYLVMFQRHEGPRWGEFVEAYGVDNFISYVRDRFANLI